MRLVLILIFFGGSFSFFMHSPTAPSQSFAYQTEDLHFQHFSYLQNELDTLLAYSRSGEREVDQLQQEFLQVRTAYKKVEFLLDYFQTKYVYLNINGGPVYKINEDNPEYLVPPNGLQAIDELVFSAEVEEELPLIDSLIQELKASVDFVKDSEFQNDFKEPIIIDAIRLGLVRIYTLGVTGFDTPGSSNELGESIISLQAMQEIFLVFKNHSTPASQSTFQEILTLFDQGIEQLSNATFEEFDRLTFLTEIINPLYKSLRIFHKKNRFPVNSVRTDTHNYEADNLFDKQFLKKEYFQQYSYIPLDNLKSIALGKRLFNDPILSNDGKMSCASCHHPDKAFTDGLPLSKTNQVGISTIRNAPTLLNATFSTRFFYDMKSLDLESQVAHVIDNPLEFNTTFRTISQKLKQTDTYPSLFQEVYGDISSKNLINKRAISNALAAYVNSLVGLDSPFDKYIRAETDHYPANTKRGFNLFMGKATCATCHFLPTFGGLVPPFYTESESEVLGVTVGLDTIHPTLDQDIGRYKNGRIWEKQPNFKKSFKTVSLRNVALTDPYMHNGTFETLEEVLIFYNKGGGAGMGLTIDNQTLSPTPLGLSTQEMEDIIAFLHTLTDEVD